MKICRFTEDPSKGRARAGILEADGVRPFPFDTPPENYLDSATEPPVALEGLRLLAPVAPSKIVCVGRNYREHAAELGNQMPKEPLLFLKPPSSIIGPEEFIELPNLSQRVEHEGELAVVIGRRARRIG